MFDELLDEEGELEEGVEEVLEDEGLFQDEELLMVCLRDCDDERSANQPSYFRDCSCDVNEFVTSNIGFYSTSLLSRISWALHEKLRTTKLQNARFFA